MASEREKYGELLPNGDQAVFIDLVGRALRKLCKKQVPVKMITYSGPGYRYQDYVVTITCSRDRKTCEVYRNRDGVLVYSCDRGRVIAMTYEYIFVENHLRSKVDG
jgi:hypothetical protein